MSVSDVRIPKDTDERLNKLPISLNGSFNQIHGGGQMANIKSAKKRILVNRTKYERNKAVKSEVKTAIKRVEDAVANKNADEAKVALNDATKLIDSACSKGVYHKNNAARKVSRLAQLVNTVA